jgi:DNA-binding MarR family transcriptional regulator
LDKRESPLFNKLSLHDIIIGAEVTNGHNKDFQDRSDLIWVYDTGHLAKEYARRDQSLVIMKASMPARSTARPVRRLSKAQYEMLAAFRYQLREFLHFSELAAQNAGLTPCQHQALLAIKGFPDRETITIGELAGQLHIAHHSAVGLVDRSVEQNLIAREQGTKDRRQVYIKLTDHGANCLPSARTC